MADGEDHKRPLHSIIAAPDLIGSVFLVIPELDPERGGQSHGLVALDPERGGCGDDTASDGGFGGGGQDLMEEGMNRSASVGQVSLSLCLPSHILSLSLSLNCVG
jgi:hypothetical protein